MPMHNTEIASVLDRIGDLVEVTGGNQFRVRAYHNAARTVEGLSHQVSDLLEQGESLTDYSGIGKDLAGKIETIYQTGSLPLLDQLEVQTGPDISRIMKIPGLGGKRVKMLMDRLGVKTVEDLERAARNGEIRNLAGFGEKTEKAILDGIGQLSGGTGRTMLAKAEEVIGDLVDVLRNAPDVQQLEIAGSFRRRVETVGDIDILVTARKGSDISRVVRGFDDVKKVLSGGSTRISVVLRSGLQVDVRVVPNESYGAALHYFTGSKAHNIALRRIGVAKKIKINEYGVFRGDERVGGATEDEVFEAVGLPFIIPELREGRGEIEYAKEKKLPELVHQHDLRGDLHMHTTETDGRATLREMVEAAKKMGYHYAAITDHSQRVAVTGGMDEKRVRKQMEAIDELNGRMKDFTVLKGIELDILDDGSLDLPDKVLKDLDIVVCSIHSKFNLSKTQQTSRMLKAMDNRFCNVVAHPTGRLINSRKPYAIDMERVISHASDVGCALEVNSQPDRLDLNDVHCKMAKEIGAKIAISTDAHSTDSLHNIRWGVGQARRGWLEANDVINSWSLKKLKEFLHR